MLELYLKHTNGVPLPITGKKIFGEVYNADIGEKNSFGGMNLCVLQLLIGTGIFISEEVWTMKRATVKALQSCRADSDPAKQAGSIMP